MQSTKSSQQALTGSQVKKVRKLGQGNLTSALQEKEKKMKWFDRWFYKKFQNVIQQSNEKPVTPMAVEDAEMDHRTTIRFTVTPARGGSVVCINSYDERRDTNNRLLYVIDENEDIAKRIGEIVSMEMLRS